MQGEKIFARKKFKDDVLGYGTSMKVKRYNRYIAVDAPGRRLAINLNATDVAYSTGAQTVLEMLKTGWRRVKHFFDEGRYDRRALMDKAAFTDLTIEIVW